MSKLLSIGDVAAFLQLQPDTVRGKVRRNEIQGFFKLEGGREWRITEEDFQAWIDKQKDHSQEEKRGLQDEK
jgi:excisionase family DNA binding protein